MNHNSSHYRLLIALFLGSIYMLLAFTGSYLTGSLALLADSGHLLVHNGALLIAFISSSIAAKKPNDRFSYGYGRMESIGGYTNSLILMAVALFVGYEAITSFINGSEHGQKHNFYLDSSLIISIIALSGLALHGISAWILYKGRKQSLNVHAVYLHLLFDVASTLVAFIAGIIIYFTGLVWLDKIAGLLIALLIFRSAYNLMKSTVKQLLDAVPDHIDYAAVSIELSKVPHVKNVHDVHIRNSNSHGVELSAHLVLEESCIHGNHWHKCRKEAKKRLNDKFGIKHSVLQIEAD